MVVGVVDGVDVRVEEAVEEGEVVRVDENVLVGVVVGVLVSQRKLDAAICAASMLHLVSSAAGESSNCKFANWDAISAKVSFCTIGRFFPMP